MPDFCRTRNIVLSFILPAFWMPLSTACAQDAYPVAGLAPHLRPKSAPVVRMFEPTPDWRGKALSGVGEPIPAGLKFLDNQGAWYTPFAHPGMTGPYDLRGWHAKRSEAKP